MGKPTVHFFVIKTPDSCHRATGFLSICPTFVLSVRNRCIGWWLIQYILIIKNHLWKHIKNLNTKKKATVFEIRRTYQAPKEHIWQAITDHKILDQWWAPQPWSCHTKSHDFREGGHWHYAMQGPEGEKHWAMAKYLEIVPGTSYTADDFFSDEKGNKNEKLPSSRWNVAL